MVEFKNPEPKVVKPGERIEFPREPMVLHGKTFYPVFHRLAWLRHEGKVSVRIQKKGIVHFVHGQPIWDHVAVADINKDESWLLLYTRLHEIGQFGIFNDDDPVESVHIEFPSEESAEVLICLAPKEEK